MKTNTLIAVIVFVGVATGGLLMWPGDENQSSSFQPAVSSSTTLPSTKSPSPPSSAPSSPALPSSESSSPTSSQSPQIDVSSDVQEKAPETKADPSFEKPSSSDLAAQVALQTQPMGPADACVEMTKTILCPIIGQMPFVRDWAGQFAIWGKTSCPMGDPAT